MTFWELVNANWPEPRLAALSEAAREMDRAATRMAIFEAERAEGLAALREAVDALPPEPAWWREP